MNECQNMNPGAPRRMNSSERFKHTIDFTHGNIMKNMALFAIPIVLSELLQNLYNTADSMVVGKFVSGTALAAMSVCSSISQLLVGFFNGMSVGASVLVSRCFGSGDAERMSAAMRNTFSFAVLLGIALSVFGIVLTPQLVDLVSVSGEVRAHAVAYLRVYLAGIMFTVIYNVSAGILRAVGDSKGPFHILTGVCALNIVLDLLFSIVMRWGVVGVAAATVISQFVSVALIYRRLRLYDASFRLTFQELRREWPIITAMLNIGVPAGMQHSLVAFSNLFVWRYVAGFEDAAIAGVGISHKLDRFLNLPCKACGLALTTCISQNIGAKRYDRLRSGPRAALALCAAYLAPMTLFFWFQADIVISLFTSDPHIMAYSRAMMHVMMPMYFIFACREVLIGNLRGYGNTKIPLLLSILGMIVLRQIYLAVALHISHDIVHIYIGYPLGWASTALFVFIYSLFTRNTHTLQ